MFAGFTNKHLFISNISDFNSIRITMKPPMYPAKLGMFLAVSIREYEHFVGHLLDNTNSKKD
jgi:hypothetical protein